MSAQISGGGGQWMGFFDPQSVTVRLNLAAKYYAIRFTKPAGWAGLAVDSVRVYWLSAAGKTIKICFWPNSTSDGSSFWPVDPPSTSDIRTIYETGYSYDLDQWDVSSLNWKTDKNEFFVGFQQINLVSQLCADGKGQPENRSYRQDEGKNWVNEYSFISNYCIAAHVSPLAAAGVTGERNSASTQFFLCQNYPNPFNPYTTIQYRIPISAPASLKIFNSLGQIVATLVDGQIPAGFYQVQWTANVASGVYFYQLKAKDFVETKKLLLLK